MLNTPHNNGEAQSISGVVLEQQQQNCRKELAEILIELQKQRRCSSIPSKVILPSTAATTAVTTVATPTQHQEDETSQRKRKQEEEKSQMPSTATTTSTNTSSVAITVDGKEMEKRYKKRIRRQCSTNDCMNQAQRGGFCFAHGAKVKLCYVAGCTKQAKKGGICIGHGAKVTYKRCNFNVDGGCTKFAVRGGVCVAHGAQQKRCKAKDCNKQAQNSGVCLSHGAKRTCCKIEDCKKKAKRGGFCIAHQQEQEQLKQMQQQKNPVTPSLQDGSYLFIGNKVNVSIFNTCERVPLMVCKEISAGFQ